MPVRRLRLGAAESFERKGMTLRLPVGMNAGSPIRSRLESLPESTDLALRIDRSVTPWTTTQLERTLLQTESFERFTIEGHQSQSVSQTGSARLLIGRATGMGPDSGPEIAMQYGILDLGEEKLIARYVGSPEHIAYNESVLRSSLLSLEGQRLMSGDAMNPASVEWDADGLPLPVGWIVEPGLPSPCASLPPPESGAAAYPVRDVTLAFRRANRNTEAVTTQQAAASCSSRRGSQGESSYVQRVEWLGVSYVIEGVFVRFRSRLVQLEVIAPEGKAPLARALLAASINRTAGAK
jgi:hypothetical protein